MDKPIIEDGAGFPSRCIARTQSIEEAERIRDQYELQGMDAKIVRKKQGTLAIYEVWVSGSGENKPPFGGRTIR